MKKYVSILLILAIVIGCFSSCASNFDSTTVQSNEIFNDEITSTKDETATEHTNHQNEDETTDISNSKLNNNDQELNSISMLYYLSITAEKIRTAKDNRVALEEIYTSLLNDINPGAIDETTQDYLKNLRTIIGSFLNINVKRERLQYIYNQKKAASIRSAVPNPLAILSAATSLDWKKFAISVVYTVVDSYTNYKNSSDAADQEFMTNGWELDDEEVETIRKKRDLAFDYMVDIVQKYKLDGNITLNEKDVEQFVKICAIDSTTQRTHRLESEEDTYYLLGDYWLELANCYFESEKYTDCLKCIEKYNNLYTGIYRKDYNYAQIMPKAIVAAQNVYKGKKYISTIEKFTDAIIENTSTEDWSNRYFAAEIYLDLYAKTNDNKYLDKAFNIAYDNITFLVDEQLEINKTYLHEYEDLTIEEPDYSYMTESEKKEAKDKYKEEKKALEKYNESQRKLRKKEVSPLYEPLVLNCDLLFALADKIDVNESDKKDIEDILQTKTNGVFLSEPVNSMYSFSKPICKSNIEFNKNNIIIPVSLLTSDVKIEVTIKDNGKEKTIKDFSLTKISRIEEEKISTFKALFESKEIKDYAWSAKSEVIVKLVYNNFSPLSFSFKVSEYKDYPLISDKVVFVKK